MSACRSRWKAVNADIPRDSSMISWKGGSCLFECVLQPRDGYFYPLFLVSGKVHGRACDHDGEALSLKVERIFEQLREGRLLNNAQALVHRA